MKKNPWKFWTWVIEIIFLLLALTAPLNPWLTTKPSVYIWTFIMMALGSVNVIILCFKGYHIEDVHVNKEHV